jgi:hypothetical protein
VSETTTTYGVWYTDRDGQSGWFSNCGHTEFPLEQATRIAKRAHADSVGTEYADTTYAVVPYEGVVRKSELNTLAAENARLRESMLELLRLAMDPKCTGYVKRDSKGDIGSIRRAGDIIEDAKALLK